MTTSEATILRRAIEAINWAMPAVNLDLLQPRGDGKYFGDFVNRGALGKFWHFRDLPSIDIDRCTSLLREATRN